MSDFVDLATAPDALRAMLTRLGLAHVEDALTVIHLSGGVSSTILQVTTPHNTFCVKQPLPKLKVQKDWFAPVSRVFAEIAWLEVAGQLVPGQVPKIIARDESSGAFVMEFLAPMEYRNWKADLLAGHCDVAIASALGDLLGKLHHATACNAEIAARFAHDAAFYALRLEPYLVEAARTHKKVASQLNALVAATQTHAFALVHGDVSPKNILIGPAGPLLLDAECALYGDPAFDLAFLLNHLLLKATYLARQGPTALYAAIVENYLPYVTWEPARDFERRTAMLLPGLLLARIDGKSPVEYLNETAKNKLRTLALAMLSSPPASLEQIVADVYASAIAG